MVTGEVYLMNFNGVGSEQQGWRPAVIIQNNVGNQFSPNLIVLPFTSVTKRVNQPTHVLIPKEAGLRKDSMVLCENPSVMSKERVGKYLTTLPEEYMVEISAATLLASSLISYIEPDYLLHLWQKAVLLNGAC